MDMSGMRQQGSRDEGDRGERMSAFDWQISQYADDVSPEQGGGCRECRS